MLRTVFNIPQKKLYLGCYFNLLNTLVIRDWSVFVGCVMLVLDNFVIPNINKFLITNVP